MYLIYKHKLKPATGKIMRTQLGIPKSSKHLHFGFTPFWVTCEPRTRMLQNSNIMYSLVYQPGEVGSCIVIVCYLIFPRFCSLFLYISAAFHEF